jgi:prevent-host-death family protein
MNEIIQPALSSVGAYDAKTRLSELLDRVEKGEQIIITRHGRPVARLIPERSNDIVQAIDALDRITARRERLAQQGVQVTREEIRAWREEGRR